MERPAALSEQIINIQNKEKKIRLDPVQFRVRNLKKKDISQVLDIYRDLGWHTGSHSVQTWLEVDPCAFKVAVTDTGKVIGVCCAVRQNQNLHFIGYYIVRKGYRGSGVGSRVWKACMEYVGQRNAGLNAVPDKTEMYMTKGGFEVLEEDWQIQENDTTELIMHPENLSDIVPQGVTIVVFHKWHLPLLFEYDSKICGYNRELTIELSCKEKDSRTLVALKDGVCVGFGTIKRSVQDVPQVAPLYADAPAIAEAMLKRLLLSYPLKKGLSMVTFTNNKAANELVKKVGCPNTYTLPRVYKRHIGFNISTQKVFAHLDINCSLV